MRKWCNLERSSARISICSLKPWQRIKSKLFLSILIRGVNFIISISHLFFFFSFCLYYIWCTVQQMETFSSESDRNIVVSDDTEVRVFASIAICLIFSQCAHPNRCTVRSPRISINSIANRISWLVIIYFALAAIMAKNSLLTERTSSMH